MTNNVNENPSAQSYMPPSWVHELRPKAERDILALDSTATLSAVGSNESDAFHREMFQGHLWSSTQKKKIPVQFHVFYVHYNQGDAYHITIHLNPKKS